MARSRTSAPAGESKTPLIVGLVLSVLLSLTLGVLFYMAIDDNKAAAEGKKSADTEKAAVEKKLRAEQDKVKLYRVLLGSGSEEDLTALKNTTEKADVLAEYKIATGKLTDLIRGYVSTESGRMPGVNFEVSNDAVFKWPAADKDSFDAGPPDPLYKVVVNAYARQRLATTKQETAERKAQDAEASYTAAKKAADDATNQLREVAAKFPADLAKEVAAIQARYQEQVAKFESQNQEYIKKERELKTASQEATIREEQERNRAQRLAAQAAQADAAAIEKQDPFAYEKPHGRVEKVSGSNVTINLGSADNVRPGLTFTVQPADTPIRGLDSRKEQRQVPGGGTFNYVRSKGTIEVLDVIGPNVSSARIVTQPDSIRDGILAGDVLYNPVWRKGEPDHIALYGLFDMDGDGSDDIRTLIRDLEKVGVRVDAYFDLARGEWVGKYNQQTAFAVEGFLPEATAGAFGIGANAAALKTRLQSVRQELLSDGVKIVKSREFFPRVGYPMQINVSQATINRAYGRYLNMAPAQSGEGQDDTDPPIRN